MPELIVTKFPGLVIKDFRVTHLADGRTVLDCGDCNMISQPRGANLNEDRCWFVDAEGIIVGDV